VTNHAAGSERANYLGGNAALPASARTANQWFNTAAFAQPAPYTFGNTGRTILDGPGTIGCDIAEMKMFPITERQHLQFRAEAFNFINHPFFHYPSNNVSSSNFGVITGTSGDSREIQFVLKYIF